jgi:hypothetical protein
MKIVLTVKKLTMENGNVVVKLEPSLFEPRTGDIVAGELFLTTTETNMVMNVGDTKEIDYTVV